MERSMPQMAKVVCSPVATPCSSTLAKLIWTAAWSLAVIKRLEAELKVEEEKETLIVSHVRDSMDRILRICKEEASYHLRGM